ncbi:MAG: HAD hydrolase-like protein [Saprospiraceae bacterium]|nr:HAD hydrolase-like protein [Saprospiraceae bacterium]
MGTLFDMDGMIADTSPYHKNSIQQFCAQHGIEASDEFLREKVMADFVGLDIDQLRKL